MPSFVVLGADTDVGKTTFSLLWLALFGERYAYWKPVETGASDTAEVRSLVPGTEVLAPRCSFTEPVAPPLAARRAGATMPSLEELLAALPDPGAGRSLLIETFGSPWSPLDDERLQLDWIQRLALPSILVSSSRLGAVGRTLQCLIALEHDGIRPGAVALVGEPDPFASEQLERRQRIPVVSLQPPGAWTVQGVRASAERQRANLEQLTLVLDAPAERAGHARMPPSLTPTSSPASDAGQDDGVLALSSWRDRDQTVLWHPYTPLRSPPSLVCVGAENEFLILEDGRRLIDGISSWWTILHGHRDPDLVRALLEASRQIDHVLFAGVTHPWGIALAELLLSSANLARGRVFYSDNGSTAVEVALKMTYQYWRLQGQSSRTRFVGFQHGYHGDTFGAMAVGRDPVFFGLYEPLLFQADILPLDAQALDGHLKRNGPHTAAVIIEPLVQGAGGMRMHSPQLLSDLFEAARKHDCLFIADEVMTGGGRTGTLWAFQQAGIQPDLICAAKTLAGGMLPLAATLVAPRIVEPFDKHDRAHTFFHGHSFTGHPLACAVALQNWRKTMALLASPAAATAPPRPGALAAFWHEALASLKSKRCVSDVRTLGTIAAVEFNGHGGYLAEIGGILRQTALDHGVFLRPLGNVLYALPPYCTSIQSLHQIAQAFHAAAAAAS